MGAYPTRAANRKGGDLQHGRRCHLDALLLCRGADEAPDERRAGSSLWNNGAQSLRLPGSNQPSRKNGKRGPMTETVLIEELLRPEAYPWHPATVELVETHVSWVFLAGDRVIKVKKAVAYGFVDHTTLASRHRSCADEVRLNRRLTNGVYLDVVPIVHNGAGYRVATKGVPVEWATLMRRLPAEGMLDALLAARVLPPRLGDRLANRLIPFHRDIAARCEDSATEVTAATSAVVKENLAELEPFAGRPLSSLQLGLVAE